MTSTPVSDFERILQRDGDDLYRLALLLAPDTASAETALLGVAQLCARAEALDDAALMNALLRALPPERPQRRSPVPAWVRGTPLLFAVARLPRMQRLALALALLRSWEPQRAAALFANDITQFQRSARDALLALGREQASGIESGGAGAKEIRNQGDKSLASSSIFELLDPANAPAECQSTRTMLALTAATGERDSTQRGHLALCVACRAAEQAWQQLATTVEQTLRGALRDERLPNELAEKLRAATHIAPVDAPRVSIHWLRWAVPLLVIGIVAALIFPRQQTVLTPADTGAVPQLPPKELVQRALTRLYVPPTPDAANQHAIWHGRWQIRWIFNDESSALLNADAWLDPAAQRHRVQIVHQAGGAPYEFELADGSATTLYAVTPNYNAQLYKLDIAPNTMSVRLHTDADQQRALLQNRLASGAWGIAANYLRQAQAASALQSWGRQQAADGAPLDIVSFRGSSPLSLPIGTPGVSTDTTTLLLALDARDGTLREVSEVSGPAAGEQTRQIVWRFAGGEWLQAPDQISAVFDVRQAWNGTATFPEHEQTLLNPALPLSAPDDFLPASDILINRWRWGLLPTVPPPGTAFAALIHNPEPDKDGAIYIGVGRRLVVQRFWDNTQTAPEPGLNDEQLTAKDRSITLYPHAPQSYSALLSIAPANSLLSPPRFLVQASGYTRAELLDVLNTLGPLTPAMFAQQAPLFTNALAQSSDVRDALIRALMLPPGNGVRHTLERHFTYSATLGTDPLSDPYHVPASSIPAPPKEYETWFRTLQDGKGEVTTQVRDDQHVYSRSYDNPSVAWDHDLVRDEVDSYNDDGTGPDGLTNIQRQALAMLSCPQVQLDTSHDEHILSVVEQRWQYSSCMHSEYGTLLRDQSSNANKARALGWSPFIAGAMQQASASAPPPLITRLHLDSQGRALFVDTHLWAESGVLLESWECVSDEYVSDNRVPAGTFSAQPPTALATNAYTEGEQRSAIHTIAITEARTLLPTPLWMPPPDPQYTLIRTEVGTRAAINHTHPDDPIEDAIEHGLAVRLRYKLADDAPQPLIHLVQGDARTFGDFLRGRAWWEASQPVQIPIGDLFINGWRVITESGRTWTLFELNNTLIATDIDTLPNHVGSLPETLLRRLTSDDATTR